MKRTDGTNINSTEELLKEWQTYFNTLLNVDPSSHTGPPIEPASEDLNIETGRISKMKSEPPF